MFISINLTFRVSFLNRLIRLMRIPVKVLRCIFYAFEVCVDSMRCVCVRVRGNRDQHSSPQLVSQALTFFSHDCVRPILNVLAFRIQCKAIHFQNIWLLVRRAQLGLPVKSTMAIELVSFPKYSKNVINCIYAKIAEMCAVLSCRFHGECKNNQYTPNICNLNNCVYCLNMAGMFG